MADETNTEMTDETPEEPMADAEAETPETEVEAPEAEAPAEVVLDDARAAVSRGRNSGGSGGEPLAGMAKVALLRGDRNSAMEYVEQILDHLQTFPDPKVTKSASAGEIKADDMTGAVPGLEGTRDPTWIYWTCYQILKDAEDPRAVNLIGKAHELIEDQAQKIEDSELRYSFLSNVRTHQKIRTELALGENT